MRRVTFWSAIYRVAAVSQYLAAGAATLIGGLLRTKPERWGDLGAGLAWVQENSWWLIPVFAGVVLVSRGLCDWIGRPWVWEAVRTVLNDFRKQSFTLSSDDAVHQHRVTLFRRVTWVWWIWPFRGKWWPWGKRRWPWSGWLVPVVRSGHTTQQTSSVFLAPDDADSAEGVAGVTWARQDVVLQTDLPDLSGTPTDEAIRQYATRAFVDVEWVRQRLAKRSPCPRSLCGIPVMVSGKLWGVIVLDSRSPSAIRVNSSIYKVYQDVTPAFLAELLKRV
jgi:hypothetical protein